jgi:hypothetical protein
MVEQAAVEIVPEPKRKHAGKSMITSRLRRQKLIDAVFSGKNLTEVAISTGISPKSASTQAADILAHPESQREFHRILEERGITDDLIAAKAGFLLDAKHTVLAQYLGKFTDERNVDALETQRKTWETILKLKGHLKDNPAGGNIEIGLMQMVVQVVRDSSDIP